MGVIPGDPMFHWVAWLAPFYAVLSLVAGAAVAALVGVATAVTRR